MNHLESVNRNRWRLPRHARIVVYEREGRGLLTIYDCAAAQKPPSAQLLGNLESVDARAENRRNPTGRTVTMREPSILEAVGEDRYRIVPWRE